MNTVKTFSALFLLVLLSFTASAQNETSKWYFGNSAALDFMPGAPVSVPGSTMLTSESCASIADAAGNLLFYTNSETVWNRSHVIMANGSGILGDNSSAQNAIVKQPGSTSVYYLFTVDDAGGANGFRYSIIDMSLAAGMGSVTVKNTLLFTPGIEGMSAVKHCNGTDIWVLSHEVTGNSFRAYLLTAAGLNTTPVISNIGSAAGNPAWTGYLKFSPNGRKVALITPNYQAAIFEIFDFDNSTGQLTGLQTLTLSTNKSAYGCEFSPDGTKFYAALMLSSEISQWDLCAGNAVTLIQSRYSSSNNYFAGMQLGPDGKIYIAVGGSATLAVISDPNAAGIACNYMDIGPTLLPFGLIQPISTFGLPAFVCSSLKKIAPFTYTETCRTVTFTPPAQICAAAGPSYTGVSWDFGDPASGVLNTSSLLNPSHTFYSPGPYSVRMVARGPCSSDTAWSTLNITSPGATLNVGGDFTICYGERKTYTVSGGNSYTWYNGAHTTTISLSPINTSTYSVTGFDANSCAGRTNFTITVSKCTGTEPLNEQPGSVKIFPNPNNGLLTLEAEEPVHVFFYNSLGKIVSESSFDKGVFIIDARDYRGGIYIVKAVSKNGTQILRLIKEE